MSDAREEAMEKGMKLVEKYVDQAKSTGKQKALGLQRSSHVMKEFYLPYAGFTKTQRP